METKNKPTWETQQSQEGIIAEAEYEKKESSFRLKAIPNIKTKEEARTMAIDFQRWASEENLSYGELVVYSGYFETLAKKFNLTEEFKENGII